LTGGRVGPSAGLGATGPFKGTRSHYTHIKRSKTLWVRILQTTRGHRLLLPCKWWYWRAEHFDPFSFRSAPPPPFHCHLPRLHPNLQRAIHKPWTHVVFVQLQVLNTRGVCPTASFEHTWCLSNCKFSLTVYDLISLWGAHAGKR